MKSFDEIRAEIPDFTREEYAELLREANTNKVIDLAEYKEKCGYIELDTSTPPED